MFVGHVGVGLALKRISPKYNLGWFMIAAFLLDLLLWSFVLVGLESATIPADYPSRHYLFFQFPFSHSLVASLIWTAAAFVLTRAVTSDTRWAWAISAGVMSHFLLDLLVHPPQIPLFGPDSAKMGFALWNNLPLELGIEFVLLALGLHFYHSATMASTSLGRYGVMIFFALITFAAFAGQLMGPAPESGMQAAISSLGTLFVLLLVSFLLDRKRIAKAL